jgi:threonine dehydratase
MTDLVTLDDIKQAQTKLAGITVHTPLILYLKAGSAEQVYFKPESLQPIGSFKLRGAYNRIASLSAAERERGVIAYSSGNHAQGVAYSAQLLGIKAVIVMPTNAPQVKVTATKSYGAEVVFYDPALEKREDVAARLMEKNPYVLVPPFNDPYIIAGQATVGLEIIEDLPDVDLVLVPVGGGGLLSGAATAIKSLNPNVKVVGIEPELAADAYASFRSGKIVELSAAETNRTLADGVRTLSLGELNFAHIQRYVDDIITVSESELREATRRLILNAKLVVEPTAALTFAAYLFHRAELPTASKIVMVLSGGNIEPTVLIDLVKEV